MSREHFFEAFLCYITLMIGVYLRVMSISSTFHDRALTSMVKSSETWPSKVNTLCTDAAEVCKTYTSLDLNFLLPISLFLKKNYEITIIWKIKLLKQCIIYYYWNEEIYSNRIGQEMFTDKRKFWLVQRKDKLQKDHLPSATSR